MLVRFDRKLYTEDAIKKAYSEFTENQSCKIEKSGKDYIVKLPEIKDEAELHHFESMVLLYTIEEKRR